MNKQDLSDIFSFPNTSGDSPSANQLALLEQLTQNLVNNDPICVECRELSNSPIMGDFCKQVLAKRKERLALGVIIAYMTAKEAYQNTLEKLGIAPLIG